MPQLNFKRLLVEYKKVQSAISAGQAQGILRCEPVGDNMLEWDVDMTFPEGSPLQTSLDALAESMSDAEMQKLTLSVRFPAEYPLCPPEVWLRRPRMRHCSEHAGAVTFGGRVCSLTLASHGWNAVTDMLSVLVDVRQSLLDSGIQAYTTVAIKKEYPEAAIKLVRLQSELFPTVNGFCKDGMTVLSATAAAPFLGDLSRLETTDKICLPFSYANEIYSHEDLRLPLTFEVTTRVGRKTHCAIFEFVNGLPDMHALLPKWLMDDLGIEEREAVRVRAVQLDLITSVKVQPHSVDFYYAVRDSGREVPSLLTESLSRFSALTEDTAVPIDVDGKFFDVQILTVEPRGAVRIIDTDVQHHFEFKVDFVPAPDLEDDAAKEEYQRRVVEGLKLKREQSAIKKQELQDRRQAARQHRFAMLRATAAKAAGGEAGASGSIEIALRLPDGSNVKGAYAEGAPISHLLLAALDSSWAKSALPWGIYLRMAFPKKVLKDGDVITKELHRSMLSVQEEEAPEDEELLAVLSERTPAGTSDEPEALSPLPMPELDEAALMARTQRAFEVQRLMRAGFNQQEAEEKFSKGEVLPPSDASRRPEPLPPAGPAAAPIPRLERTLSEEEERQRKIEVVVSFTGVDAAVAQVALEDASWITAENIVGRQQLSAYNACMLSSSARYLRVLASKNKGAGRIAGSLRCCARSVCQAAGHLRLRFCRVAGSVAASKLGWGAYRSKPALAMQYVLQRTDAGQADKVLVALESFALQVSCWLRHVTSGSSTTMIRKEDALPGRQEPLKVSAEHYVLGTPMKGPWPEGMSKFVFANGCFWGSEKGIWRLPAGIFSTAVGYAAGFTPNPTYEEVVTGRTGHAEAVQVIFDPAQIDLVDILRWFWEAHDPTQYMRQGADQGTQYRSGLYYFDEDQRELFVASKKAYQDALQAAGKHGEISTEIRAASDFPDGVFWYAEDWHQQYLAKPGSRPYCSAMPQEVSLPPFSEWATPSLAAKFWPKLPEAFWKQHGPAPHSVVESPDSPIEWSQFSTRIAEHAEL
ncbi:msrA1 [Symbiodinium sp. CCMP2456]|nr:msrA1 [Symbiodinium sp. CCMP2456]